MREREQQKSPGKTARRNLRAGLLWAACVACAMAVAGGAAFARHSAERRVAARAFASAAADAPAAENDPVTVDANVRMKTRDGVTLNADIYRPNLPGKFPVLMTRTPYMKNDSGQLAQAMRMASRGYVVVVQDTRGRYASGGDWYTFKNESNDGYDAVEWAAALPQSDGRVGMFGGSYVGATQWLAAIAQPPHLAGIAPYVTASNYHNGWTYQGGAFEQWFNQSWTSALAQNTMQRLIDQNTNAVPNVRVLPLEFYPLFNGTVPGGTAQTRALAPYYLDWLAHPDYDDYWKPLAIEEHYAQVKVPVLDVTAWYDIFQGGALRNFLGMKQDGGTDAARTQDRLLIEIGGHAGDGEKIGDVDFGPEAVKYNYTGAMLDWYDYLFKGISNEYATDKPVRMFVLGADVYRQESDWPPAESRPMKYFLASGGNANSATGDGTLTLTPSANDATRGGAPSDQYIYDPGNPVATIGGPLCCDAIHWQPGPRDQREDEARQDVLVYSTAPFSKDTEVAGPVSVELYAKSSAVDTDFTAKLVDVWPDGTAVNLTEGIVRARYRDSQEHPELLTPGTVYKFSIDAWSTANVFLRGHRLRLEISSSNFPRFDRNLNTEESPEQGTKFVPATNTILHDAAHPSALLLRVMPAAAAPAAGESAAPPTLAAAVAATPN
ncbi:MAG: CocE/NonD family hydrolase [Candidatus Acidiferrales bacterium]